MNPQIVLALGLQQRANSLLQAGYQIEQAGSVQELLDLVQTSRPAIVLLCHEQLSLPGLLQDLKGSDVFVVTSEPEPADLFDYLEQGLIRDVIQSSNLVTDLKRAWLVAQRSRQAQLEQNLETIKNQILSHLYHHLQGPLTALEGYIEILSTENPLDERFKQIMRQLQLCAKRFRHYFYVLHILSLSSELTKQRKRNGFFYHQLLKDFQQDARQRVLEKSSEWTYSLDASKDCLIADYLLLKDLLLIVLDLSLRAEYLQSKVNLQTSNISGLRLLERSESQLDSGQYQKSYLDPQTTENYLLISLQFQNLGAEFANILQKMLAEQPWPQDIAPEIVFEAYLIKNILLSHQAWVYLESMPGNILLFSFALPIHSD